MQGKHSWGLLVASLLAMACAPDLGESLGDGSDTAAPTDGWVTDAADGDDEGDDPDLAFAGWYAYDFMTHVLTPHPLVYVVRTVEGNAFAIEILDYYDEAGTSAIFTIRWAPLAPS